MSIYVSIYRKQVSDVLEAVVVHSPTLYSWFGRSSPRLPTRVEHALTPRTARNHLVYSLASQLYSDFFTRGTAEPSRWETETSMATRGPFIDALSEANTGTGFWEDGWIVVSVADATAIVRRNGFELGVNAADCFAPPKPEGLASIRFPKEFRSMSPGFYIACGNRVPASGRRRQLVRIYWNLRAAGAISFVHGVTSVLNASDIPFRLKVLNDPARFTRCDAAVIYVLDRDSPRTLNALQGVYEAISHQFDPRVPAFTKRLTPGVGFAENPPEEESFGQHRCRLLADGIVRAFERDVRGLKNRLAVVGERFTEAGTSLDAPYMSAADPGRSHNMEASG